MKFFFNIENALIGLNFICSLTNLILYRIHTFSIGYFNVLIQNSVILLTIFIEKQICISSFFSIQILIWIVLSNFAVEVHFHNKLLIYIVSSVFVIIALYSASLRSKKDIDELRTKLVFLYIIALGLPTISIDDLSIEEIVFRFLLFSLTFFLEEYVTCSILKSESSLHHVFLITFPILHVEIYFLFYPILIILSLFVLIQKKFYPVEQEEKENKKGFIIKKEQTFSSEHEVILEEAKNQNHSLKLFKI